MIIKLRKLVAKLLRKLADKVDVVDAVVVVEPVVGV